MASDPEKRERITDNGIRIRGADAADLVAKAAVLRLQPPSFEDLVWAANFRARPRIGKGSAVPGLLQAICEGIRESWDACPPLTRETPVGQPSAKFSGMSWDVEGEAGAWQGELVWRHKHPVLTGVACTTYLLIKEQQDTTFLDLVIACDGGIRGARGFAGAGQARPALLDRLRRSVALTFEIFDGNRRVPADGTPKILTATEMNSFVANVMIGERDRPIAMLAPVEHEGYLVEPRVLAEELFGLAQLYVMDRQACTFALTDAINDKRLSAYFGALRIYSPGFTCADSGVEHPLLLRDRIEDPVERAGLIGRLGHVAAQRRGPIESLRSRIESNLAAAAARAQSQSSAAVAAPAAATDGAPAAAVTATPQDGGAVGAPVTAISGELHLPQLAALPGILQSLAARIGDLSGTIGHLVTVNAQLSDEIARLRTATAVRATSTNAMERRLASIETLLDPGMQEEEEQASDSDSAGSEDESLHGPTLVEMVQHAGAEYSENLLVLDSAELTASESPYQDVDRLAAVLQAMAFVAKRRQEGTLGTGMKAAFQEFGIDYRASIAKSTSEKLRQQYGFAGADGQKYECYEHIAIGGTYDPRRCLRIYFTSRAPNESRFVIGHVGRHLTVMTSS